MIFSKILKRYAFFLCSVFLTLVIALFNKNIGLLTLYSAESSFKQMLSVLPPIMLMLGLMDVWVPRETMMKYMGQNSGLLGILLSIGIGSIAAGPMYAAFPFTIVLIKKGVKFSNIIIFLNAWCVIKISTLLFEVNALGPRFTFIRFLIDFPGVIIMGYLVERCMSKRDLDELYLNSKD